MTLIDLYNRVAAKVPEEPHLSKDLADATYINIDNKNNLQFETFLSVDLATETMLATEYKLPHYILVWQHLGLWMLEGANNKRDFREILNKKIESESVTKIVRVDSRTGNVDVIRNSAIASAIWLNKEVIIKKGISHNLMLLHC